MLSTAEAILVVWVYVVLGYLVWRHGLHGLWSPVKHLIHRLAWGTGKALYPPPRPAPTEVTADDEWTPVITGCTHTADPAPVVVHDGPEPETVTWLCPDCRSEVPDPEAPEPLEFDTPEYDTYGRRLPIPPKGPGGGSRPRSIQWGSGEAYERAREAFWKASARPGMIVLPQGVQYVELSAEATARRRIEVLKATLATRMEDAEQMMQSDVDESGMHMVLTRDQHRAYEGIVAECQQIRDLIADEERVLARYEHANHQVEQVRAHGHAEPVREVCSDCDRPAAIETTTYRR